MSKTSARKTFARSNLALAAMLAAAATAATPLVMGATRALAVSGEAAPIAATLRVDTVDVAPVAAPKAEASSVPCLRKVRVVYGGYGTPEGCAAR